MKKVLSIVAGVIMVVVPLNALPAPAQAATCYALAETPYWDGGYMIAIGSGHCSSSVNMSVTVALYRDGTNVAMGTDTCTGTSCATAVLSRNLAGNQKWCGRTWLYQNGSIVASSGMECETTGYISPR
ncbi:hypothetical protein [Microbispora sp. NPDC049125]|uniref:hypothetical protein n=1 Tax=Microbispora sp. NPDC049125 TaxID=3154929 RepID=UPI0034653CF5